MPPPADPKVSVFLLTHDHVDWIAQALDSALGQVTRFPFEIVVADDCSTDGTRAIVADYARRHPDTIRTVMPERNLGVAGIWLTAARQARGEYVAILEGDDYWTSTAKLATQVALMDANPDWSSCFHDATLFHDDGRFPPRPATPAFDRETFELDDVLRACFIPFLTVMFRREVLDRTPDWLFEYRWFDWLFHIYCARQGTIGRFEGDLAAYRVHDRGNWSSRDRSSQIEDDLRVYERLARELPERRALIERCVEQRHCQLAVEAAAVPLELPVLLVDPADDMPAYFNGRHAAKLPLDGRATARTLSEAVRRAEAEPIDAPHYAARAAPRPVPAGSWCAIVVPATAADAVERNRELSERLDRDGELRWSDDRCLVWELRVDSAGNEPEQEEEAATEMGALVEIVDVSLAEPLGPALRGGFLDEPRPGSLLDAHALEVLGWALGADERAVAVEFAIDGEPFWRAPLSASRPDLVEAFADRPEAATAGFRTTINAIGTPATFELDMAVVLRDQRRVALGSIRGQHRWRRDRVAAYADLVSVVIPCFAQAHYLGEAIESVLAQDYPHLEIVVVDDGSPDNAARIAARYPGVRCIEAENSGMAGARNVGIRATNGDFLIFLDSDDRLLPTAVSDGLRGLAQHPECAAAIGTYRRIAHDGEPLATHDQPPVESDQYAELLRSNWAGFPARALYRRAVFEHVHGFDTELDAAADFALNLEVARQFPVCSHPALVAEHREHGRNSSGDAARMLVQSLAAVRRQRPHVRKSSELKRAYRDGRRFWRSYWGNLLVGQARDSLRRRELGTAAREIGVLARRYPRGLPRLLRRRPPAER